MFLAAKLPAGGAGALKCLQPLCMYFNAKIPSFHNLAILLFSEIVIFMINDGKTSCPPMQSVIIRLINKSDSAVRSSDFVITRMITDRIGLYSVLLPLLIKKFTISSIVMGLKNSYFSTNSLHAKLLSDSLLLDTLLLDNLLSGSSIGQSHSKL